MSALATVAAGGSRFRRIEAADGLLVVEPSLADGVCELDLLDRRRLHALLREFAAGSGRTTNAIVPLVGGPRLHLRPLRRGGWLGGWLGARLPSLARPIAEIEVTACLHARGAPVPAPALVVGHRVGWHWTATVGTLQEEGTSDGVAFLAQSPSTSKLARAARAAGRAVRRFHDLGGRHADLHIKNLLVRERDEGTDPEILVIDLSGARILDDVPPARRMRELMRLGRSLQKRGLAERVGARGHAAFFAGYVGRDRALRAALLAHRRREAFRTAVHALAYDGTR